MRPGARSIPRLAGSAGASPKTRLRAGWTAQHKPRPAAPLRGGWASRCTRLPPPPPPSLRPHAHARLAVAAGRPPAGLVWGSAGTKWQRLGHLSCHCRKRTRKTGAWAVGHLPAALSARARVRNGSPCSYAQGGDSWAAPLSLATLQAEQVAARSGAGCGVRGWRCPELGSWVGSPGLWRRRGSHERQKWMPRRVVGSSRTAASTCCAEAGAGAQGRRVPSPSRPDPGG